MINEVVRIANANTKSDEKIDPDEVEEVMEFKYSLRSKGSFASVTQRLEKSGKEVSR